MLYLAFWESPPLDIEFSAPDPSNVDTPVVIFYIIICREFSVLGGGVIRADCFGSRVHRFRVWENAFNLDQSAYSGGVGL